MGLHFGTDVQESEISVGGSSWSVDDTHLTGRVILTAAYFTETQKGSTVLNLATADKEGNERSYSLIITNRNGETFYAVKDRKTQKPTGEQRMLPGFQLANDICYATTGKSFQDNYKSCKKKTIDLMDWESRKEIPTEVLTMPTILKKPMLLGVIKLIDNKWKGGKALNEKRESNEIHIVFNKDGLTSKEVRENETETKTKDKWVKYWLEGDNAPRVKDTYKHIEGLDEEESSGSDPFGTGEASTEKDPFADSDDEASTDSEPAQEPNVADDEEDPFAD